ncbi:MAG: GAF domain-containing protein, partial [Chloroflexia bacterium]
VGGAAVLAVLYFWLPAERANLGLAAAAVTMGWSIVLGYLVQWVLGQWQAGHRLALQIAHHEHALNRIRERLQSWERTWKQLRRANTPRELLEVALQEALIGTGSSFGLVTTRGPGGEGWRTACWEGFSPRPGTVGLRIGERVPSPSGETTLEVRHLLHVALCLQGERGEENPALGHIYVARHEGPPYTDSDGAWLRILASYTAILLDNLLLRRELGHVQEQADSIARAGWSLVTVSDPETALEFACRSVIAALGLERVVLFLSGRAGEPGCYVLTCPAEGTASTVWHPLQGRGLSLLRRLLSSGGPLVLNRRTECPELFAEMGWDEPLQSVACFPLSVPQQSSAILCLLATRPGAFSSYAQQSLAIFCGEVALALENACLRQTGTAQPQGEEPMLSPWGKAPFFSAQTLRAAEETGESRAR